MFVRPGRPGRPAGGPTDAIRRQDQARQARHEAYAESRDPGLREQLLDAYDGFACSLALKFRRREPVDDLMQVARIGLLQAIDRFDIVGELKRHLRDRSWSMRAPRPLKDDYLRVMRAVDELTSAGSRPGTGASSSCASSRTRRSRRSPPRSA
ncbi:MAG TPA: sigma factor [Acidimicrobiia bacterium]|nr:sigma factor [Acidimicrobiia bacterium]